MGTVSTASSLTDSWVGMPTASALRDRVRSLVTADEDAMPEPSPAPMPEPPDHSEEGLDAADAAEKAAEEAAWRAATAATAAAEAQDAAAVALAAVAQSERDANAAEHRAGIAVDASLELQIDAAAATSARFVEWMQTQRHANAILVAVDCLADRTHDELSALGIDRETADLLREAAAIVAGSATDSLPRPATLASGTPGEAPVDIPVVVAQPVDDRRARYKDYMYIAGGITLLLAALRALSRHRNPDPSWQEAQQAMREAQTATLRAAEAKQRAEQVQRSARVGGASAAIGATVGTLVGGPIGTVIGGVVGGAIGGIF